MQSNHVIVRDAGELLRHISNCHRYNAPTAAISGHTVATRADILDDYNCATRARLTHITSSDPVTFARLSTAATMSPIIALVFKRA